MILATMTLKELALRHIPLQMNSQSTQAEYPKNSKLLIPAHLQRADNGNRKQKHYNIHSLKALLELAFFHHLGKMFTNCVPCGMPIPEWTGPNTVATFD